MKQKFLLLFLSTFLICFICGCSKKEVDLKEYLKIETEGMDGYGEAYVSLNYDRLCMDIIGEEKLERLSEISKLTEGIDHVSKMYNIKCDADKYEGLKNGETITITFTDYEEAEETFNIEFVNTEATYQIEGLTPVKTIDTFEGVSVEYDGDITYGYDANVRCNEKYEDLLYYDVNPKGNVSVGDTVTVTCSYDEDDLLSYGYAIAPNTSLTKEFVVSGIDSYIQSFSDIDTVTLDEMKSKAISLIKSKYFGENGSYYDIQNVLAYKKNLDYGWESSNGKLISDIVYEGSYYKQEDYGNSIRMMFAFNVKDIKTSATIYAVVQLRNIILKADGSIYVSYEDDWNGNYSVVYLDTNINDIENELVTNNEYKNVDISTAAPNSQSDAGSQEYMLPDSDSRYITKDELSGFSAEQCRIARNELYARHGRIFDDKKLKKYFKQFSWYKPKVKAKDFKESMLNEYEITNRDLIIEYEEEQGYR